MTTFTIAAFLLFITPGPGVLSAAGVGAAYGRSAGFRYILGLFLGNNIVALAAVSGLAAILFTIPLIRIILLLASIMYLGFLAFRIAFAGSTIAFITNKKQPGVLTGITLQFINPKAYAVNTTLFGGFAFSGVSLTNEILLKFLILNLIWIPVHFLWIYAGLALRKLDLSPLIQRSINYFMAASMLVVLALASSSML